MEICGLINSGVDKENFSNPNGYADDSTYN